MNARFLIALPLPFFAAPAAATQGFTCRTTAPEGVTMSVIIGSLGVAGATLTEGGQRLSSFDDDGLVLGQNWVDERALLIDLLSPDRSERVARLRVGLGGALETRQLTGWLEYAGRRWRTVCAPD
jgi:hypothetical protein